MIKLENIEMSVFEVRVSKLSVLPPDFENGD